jgi:hypothetical protein
LSLSWISRRTGNKVGRWLEHVRKLYPDDVEHMLNWLAHLVQCPGTKINHGLVLGGEPGIGKDTILTPVRIAVGTGNCEEIPANAEFASFNGYVKSVLLRINELHNLGDAMKFCPVVMISKRTLAREKHRMVSEQWA